MRLRVPLFAVALLLLAGSFAAPAAALGANVTRATLSNGLRVVIVRNPIAPVVTTEINYLVGSDETPPGFPGMAHAQEHMFFRSHQGLSATQLADINALLGGDFDADTQNSITQYFMTIPAQYLDIALHIEAIRMRGALDLETEWSQERGAIEQEVSQDLSNSFYRYYDRAIKDAFAGTPYAHTALGTRSSFDKTTGAMLRRFYDAWYRPNNAILIIAGDVDPSAALASVKALFGGIPSRPLPPTPAFNLKPMMPATIRVESDLPVPISIVTYRLPGSGSSDYAAAQVLSDVLASQRGDLFALGAEGKALQAGFQTFQPLKYGMLGVAYVAMPPGADMTAATNVVKNVVANYVKYGFPSDLVEAAKRHEVASALFDRNSISGLAETWSQSLAAEGRNSPDDDVNAIKKVTADDVLRVARTYLVNNTAVVGLLIPKPAGAPGAAHGFGGAESFAPKEAKETPLPDWARNALARIMVPASTVNPVTAVLPNGLTLIVQTERISPTVTVVGEVKHTPDLQTPQGKEGVDDVLAGLFSYGTTSLNRLAFQKALDDVAANEQGGASFSLSVLSQHFDRGVQLLADNVLHPALPAADFAIVQRQVAQATEGELKSPDYLTQRSLLKALYPAADPVLREATPATISTLSLADVKAYYGSTIRPDETTIVVIGDVTPAEAKSSIGKWFGGWTTSGPKPQTDLPPVPQNAPSAATVPATGRVQDVARLAETLALRRSNPDYYALQMGNAILGGGFYATRFYKDLRRSAGLVYYVGASLRVGKTRSSYTVEYGCDPKNVSRARRLIVRDLRAMQTSPASPGEMQLARALLIRAIPLAESSEERIANGLLQRSLQQLPLDEPIRAARRYISITNDQVRKAFAKWIRPDAFVQIVEGPPPQ